MRLVEGTKLELKLWNSFAMLVLTQEIDSYKFIEMVI